MEIKIEDVVRLINDVFYGTNKETDHVKITSFNDDGTFNGVGLTENGTFSHCHIDFREKTMEK